MKERSYRQVKKFSWEKSVRRIMDVYQEVLGPNGKAESSGKPESHGQPVPASKNTAGVA
jgi:hypothetical protein